MSVLTQYHGAKPHAHTLEAPTPATTTVGGGDLLCAGLGSWGVHHIGTYASIKEVRAEPPGGTSRGAGNPLLFGPQPPLISTPSSLREVPNPLCYELLLHCWALATMICNMPNDPNII